jgi:hypothetical protein
MYAGAEYEALAQLPLELQEYWGQYSRKPVESEELGTELGIFEGVTDRFRTFDGHTITLFRGLLSEFRQQLLTPLKEPNKRDSHGREQIPLSKSYTSQFRDTGFRVIKSDSSIQSICQDGSIMQLSIT